MYTRARNLFLDPRVENHLAVCDFFERSDKRSLCTQIRDLVATAQDVAENELNQRRRRLRRLLEEENKIYEKEFADKVKSRVDEDIHLRKESLLQIKEERKRQEKAFLDQKNIQRQLESCFEVRDALRFKETMLTKEIQLEQILEKERAQLRERQQDDYWRKVDEINAQRYDQRQAKEDQMKQDMRCTVRCNLEQQIEIQKIEAEQQRATEREQAKAMAKIAEEVRLEEFDRQHASISEKMLAYRADLLATIAENKARRDAEECERIEEHRQLMREIKQEQQDHSAAMLQRKRAVYKATMEYLDYVRRMRQLEEDTQNMRNANIDALRHVDICTKSNIKRELQRKAEIAALCYAELRRQICEEYERRLRDKQEQRAPKIIENHFAHPEKTRAELMTEKLKLRKGLDEQLLENARVRAEEEVKYNAELKQAAVNLDFCKELADKYLAAGLDYLPPHANWLIYICPQRQFADKPLQLGAAGDSKDDAKDTCRKPCGCQARADLDCPHNNWLASKRAPGAEQKRF
ncbi:cilia- and flagella-associated protein 53 [Bactrocera dorsalis]|uniref:Cilia- and flagella-associated protein 53 n=1 Tax=Bactrocera dorsalis TaxID=27457 RepID=A0A6I9VWS4_BACDO|nr:cilia- and flagella-associated protein 53 [Bactrocera dorsalis]